MHDVGMRQSVGALVVSVLLAAATGCSDDEPAPTSSIAVYLVRDGKVAPVRRVVEGTEDGRAATAIDALSDGPTAEERDAGYATSLPASLPLELDGGAATVDGAVSDLGAAQLVNTLSQFPEVDRIVVEGEELTRQDVDDETPPIVIESPLDGDVVTSPVTLRGTANVFEATVSIEVRDAGGKVVLESFTTATSGTGTRGTYETELELPDGATTIVAFESSAKDGTPLHETDVEVTVER